MLTQFESKLSADQILIECPTCKDEYSAYASWIANEVVYRDKECMCAIDPRVEREAIALHHNPVPVCWAGIEVDERIDREDMAA